MATRLLIYILAAPSANNYIYYAPLVPPTHTHTADERKEQRKKPPN